MSADLRAKFEAEAEAQRRSAQATNTKAEPTGVAALIKQHKDHINPPPPKVSWKANSEGRTDARAEAAHVRYEKTGGKPTGPPPPKSLTDLP